MLGADIMLTDEEFLLIRDYVYAQTGMYFKENKKYLIKSRLSNRLKSLRINSFKDYYYKVKFDRNELIYMINALTTNETSFFRNPHHMREIRERILPEVYKKSSPVKIWSAGCSSGEEPYSIAMIVKELEAKNMRISVDIVGSDIDEEVLKKARDGVYTRNSFRSVDPKIIDKYFEIDGTKYILKNEIKRMVQFSKINLVDTLKMGMMKNFDLILCRNVLIYFGMEARKQVISHFYRALKPGGYFILGHSETLHGVFDGFKVVHVPGAVLYKKE